MDELGVGAEDCPNFMLDRLIDLVYEITKAVLGQNARLKQAIAAASETLATNAPKNTFLPYHPGAAKYLREVGQAIPDNLVMA